MSKVKIRLIIFLTSLALLAMALIQLVWINNAIQLQLENFNKTVNISISEIVNRLNLKEEFDVYLKVAGSHSPRIADPSQYVANRSAKGRRLNEAELAKLKRFLSLMENSEFLDFYNSELLDHFRKLTEKKRIDESKDAAYIQQLLSDTAVFRNPHFISDLRRQFRVISAQPITQRINPVYLDSLIHEVLKENKIDIEHTHSILESPNDSILKSIPNEASLDQEASFITKLFPNNQSSKEYYLLITFEGQRFHLFKNIGMILLISLLTILLLTMGFYYTINTILQQRRLAEMKTDFINNMTHELKTPIATITLASEALLDMTENAQFRFIQRYSNMILEENNRMKNNVDRILNTALLESKDFKLEMRPVDVNQVINRILHQVDLRLKAKNSIITCKLDAYKHTIVADDTHFTNVINNIIDNAIKYSNENLYLEIRTKNTNNGILITISDNGIGMTTEEQKRVFEKFYRASTGDLHNVKGFGLGLSYVKSIIDAHKGFITLESEIGRGSKFDLFFPFEPNKI